MACIFHRFFGFSGRLGKKHVFEGEYEGVHLFLQENHVPHLCCEGLGRARDNISGFKNVHMQRPGSNS